MSRLSERDRRALLILGACAAVFSVVYLWPDSAAPAVGAVESVPAAEKRFQRLRRQAASAAGSQEALQRAAAELAKREKGVIGAETAPQAQAQLLQIVRRVSQAQQPPLVLRNTEFAPPKPFGDAYGEVSLTVTLECGIEQIVNLLTDFANQPELISTTGLQFSAVTSKQKLVPVRITVSGIVPRKLVPEKKGGTEF